MIQFDGRRSPALAVLATADTVRHIICRHEHELAFCADSEAPFFVAVDEPAVRPVVNLRVGEVGLECPPAGAKRPLGGRPDVDLRLSARSRSNFSIRSCSSSVGTSSRPVTLVLITRTIDRLRSIIAARVGSQSREVAAQASRSAVHVGRAVWIDERTLGFPRARTWYRAWTRDHRGRHPRAGTLVVGPPRAAVAARDDLKPCRTRGRSPCATANIPSPANRSHLHCAVDAFPVPAGKVGVRCRHPFAAQLQAERGSSRPRTQAYATVAGDILDLAAWAATGA